MIPRDGLVVRRKGTGNIYVVRCVDKPRQFSNDVPNFFKLINIKTNKPYVKFRNRFVNKLAHQLNKDNIIFDKFELASELKNFVCVKDKNLLFAVGL